MSFITSDQMLCSKQLRVSEEELCPFLQHVDEQEAKNFEELDYPIIKNDKEIDYKNRPFEGGLFGSTLGSVLGFGVGAGLSLNEPGFLSTKKVSISILTGIVAGYALGFNVNKASLSPEESARISLKNGSKLVNYDRYKRLRNKVVVLSHKLEDNDIPREHLRQVERVQEQFRCAITEYEKKLNVVVNVRNY